MISQRNYTCLIQEHVEHKDVYERGYSLEGVAYTIYSDTSSCAEKLSKYRWDKHEMTSQTTVGETYNRKVEGLLEAIRIEVQYKWKGDDQSNLQTNQAPIGSLVGEFVEAE